MKFSKEFLQELAWGGGQSCAEDILNELVDSSRWSLHYRQVFKFDGKFYETFYSVGATESQDESPYEYEEDMIECREVVPVEQTVIVYKRVTQ